MKSIYFVLSILLLTVYSCKDKNPQAECGCDSPTVKVHENVYVSYLGNNTMSLRNIVGGDMIIDDLYEICSQTDTLSITADRWKPDYIVSGNVKNSCFDGPTLTVKAQHFEITSIKKIP